MSNLFSNLLAAPETYENPALLIEADAKAKPQKKGKPAKQKDGKKVGTLWRNSQ